MIPVEPAEKASKGGRKRSSNIERAVQGSVAGGFSAIAYFTEHPHWFVSEAEALSITDPVLCWIDTLPPKAVKKVEQNIWPIFLALGLLMVLLPRVLAEMKLRGRKGNTLRAQGEAGYVPGPVPSEAGYPYAAGYPDPAANGAGPGYGEGQDGGDDWRPPRIPGVHI